MKPDAPADDEHGRGLHEPQHQGADGRHQGAARGRGGGAMKGRVVFIVRLKPDVTDEQFLEAYEAVRYEVAQGVKGHIVDQVCKSDEDRAPVADHQRVGLDRRLLRPGSATEEHRDQAKPMRECMDEAKLATSSWCARRPPRRRGRAHDQARPDRGQDQARRRGGGGAAVRRVRRVRAAAAGRRAPPQPVRARRRLRPLRGDRRRLRRGGRRGARPPALQGDQRKLDAYITPYDPETWRSPKDAQAREFYSWDPPE